MRKLFPGYYQPTREDFSHMWETSIIIFDTNILLNLYRYTAETREEFFSVLKNQKLSNKLWIPYQVAQEFQEKRLEVIEEQQKAYENISKLIADGMRSIKSQIEQKYARHPIIDVSSIINKIEPTLNEIEKIVSKLQEKHPKYLDKDPIHIEIADIFSDRVGSSFSGEKLQEIYKDGEFRYQKKIPPGYKDGDKSDTRKYGDLVIWMQILEKAKETKQNIIFITDDSKEDWWWKFSGRTIGPRPELVQEMSNKCGVSFYIYQPSQFLKYATQFLKNKEPVKSIKEIQDLSKVNEDLYDLSIPDFLRYERYPESDSSFDSLSIKGSNRLIFSSKNNQLNYFNGLKDFELRQVMEDLKFQGTKIAEDVEIKKQKIEIISSMNDLDLSEEDFSRFQISRNSLFKELDNLKSQLEYLRSMYQLVLNKIKIESFTKYNEET